MTAGPAVYLFAHTLFGYRLTGLVYKTKLFGTLACVTVGLCRPPRTRAGVSRTANRSTGGGDRI